MTAGKPIGANVGAHKQVRARLRRGIRAARLHWRIFVGECAGSYVAVNFVGGDMHESLDIAACARPAASTKVPVTLVSITGRGFVDAAVHVRFGGEMDDRVAPAMAASTAAASQISPLTNEYCGSSAIESQIREVSGVGQLVVIDDRIVLATGQGHDVMKFDPMKPAPPVTKIFIGRLPDVRRSVSARFILFAPVSATSVIGAQQRLERSRIGPPAVEDFVGELSFPRCRNYSRR